MFPFGPLEFVIIMIILMIFFGAGKLGDIGGAVRRGITLFKQNAGIGDGDKKDEKKPLKPS
jgi:sec-independent protein translocase protein TatA